MNHPIMNNPRISIITPCYNMRNYLERCVASVKDQQVACEHIVIDGYSSDGTKEWLASTSGIRWVSEKDRGMYDALNKGLAMTRGDIVGHLNADEQYLPHTLEAVVRFFDEHPEVDYITGNFLTVNETGELIAYRKAFPPFWPFFFSNYLYTFTCTFFYRKKVAQQLRYNDSLKSVADADFFYRVQQQGFKGAHINKFLATFTHTGRNLSHSPFTMEEKEAYEKTNLPKWFRPCKPLFKLVFYTARILYGTLWHKSPIQYEIYPAVSAAKQREVYKCENPTWRLEK
jgi:glycosyltransferase involved in cell wall biosynthesis